MTDTHTLDAAIQGLAVAVERAKAEVTATVSERERDDDRNRELTDRALVAEARVAQLENELTLVISRVEEFEYGVRVALFDAFKLVRNMSDAVGSLLHRTPLGELPRLLGPAQDTGAEAGTAEVSGAGVTAASQGWAGADPGLETERLDAALERLRASTEPREDDA